MPPPTRSSDAKLGFSPESEPLPPKPKKPPKPERRIPRPLVIPFEIILAAFCIALAAGFVALSLLPAFAALGRATSRVNEEMDAVEATFRRITLQQSSQIYADNGDTLLSVEHGTENRKVVALGKISTITQQAVVAIEDHDFYEHGPLDTRSIFRALITNIAAGEITQGGSTITQQLVKNAEIGSNAQTFARKFQEAALASRMETLYDKDEILGLYLNQVYLGNGVYGIGTASQYYFDRPASKLKLPEAALLAGMVQAPADYDPIQHTKAAKERRNVVLDQMVQYGEVIPGVPPITAEQAAKAKKTPIQLHLRKQKDKKEKVEPFFLSYVRRELLDLDNHEFDKVLGTTDQQRENQLFGGGLKIITTLDTSWQDIAQRVAEAHLGAGKGPQAAIATVESDGAVRVLLSGQSYDKTQTDLVAPLYNSKDKLIGGVRQPGSSFKPFVLIAAFRAGINPSSTYSSSSPYRSAKWDNSCHCVSNAEPFSSGGNIDLWTATANSVNVVFAQLALEVGADKIVEAAQDAGITSALPEVPSISLGSASVSPLEMASAFTTFANAGEHCKPYLVSKIEDAKGKTLYKIKPDCKKAVEPNIAQLITKMLEGVVQGGTGTAAQLDRPVAGKTGTSQDSADLWFVGFVPQYSTAVWVGFPYARIPQEGEYGGTVAAPIWHDYMVQILRDVKESDFDAARKLKVKAGEVPDVVGITEDEAKRALERAKFDVKVNEVESDQLEGIVVAQDPEAGRNADEGSTVTIDVSNGKGSGNSGDVPNVVGLPQSEAERAISRAGYSVSVREEDSTQTAGTVIEQKPSAGEQADPGSTVRITVSTGEEGKQKIPDVVGQTKGSATSELEAAGFSVAYKYETVSSKKDDGIVLDQSPSGGEQGKPGQTVRLRIGKF